MRQQNLQQNSSTIDWAILLLSTKFCEGRLTKTCSNFTSFMRPRKNASLIELAAAFSEVKELTSFEETNNEQTIVLTPFHKNEWGGLPFLPPSFPKEWGADLIRLHGHPPVWFTGQFVSYLMRSSPQLSSRLTEKANAIGLGKEAIVGLHVRRTDKLDFEMTFHSIEEYMELVDNWFAIESLKKGKQLKKRVFIATDDISVVNETLIKYKDYEILVDMNVVTMADVYKRTLDVALFGIISDVKLLSKCDFVVCTFSSNVCRLAYELMQGDGGDAAARFYSIDHPYFFWGQNEHEREVIIAHSPRNAEEIELQIGDVIGFNGVPPTNPVGFLRGRNNRTGKEGLYPIYKVKEKWRIEDFPLYPNVKL
uniref:GT23 domain-containing protein n=1 Tax=Plectus sambesii TaxID=2011161 RepID=A0A914URA9_9BILA